MNRPKSKPRKPHELTALAVKGCLIAKDAAYNISDLITTRSAIAALAVKDCEKELDQIERQIDERLPQGITQGSENMAPGTLACLKFITDPETNGGLLFYFAPPREGVRGFSKKENKPTGKWSAG